MGRQVVAFTILLLANAFLAFLTFALGLQGQWLASQGMASPLPWVPEWVLGLANAGIILVVYGALGLAGLWFARRLEIPGVFRERAGWRNWLFLPLAIGVAVGLVIVLLDRAFALSGGWGGFPHPPFPMSLIASATAGIGEEIIYRMFVMGLWAFVLNLILRRWRAGLVALWAGNVIAALAFAAAHIPAVMFLLGVATLAEVPPLVLAEVFVLNGLVALVAGERYMREGLVGAAGVHFWADVVWHVAWPLVGMGV